jgi:RHS repeat-associated protein
MNKMIKAGKFAFIMLFSITFCLSVTDNTNAEESEGVYSAASGVSSVYTGAASNNISIEVPPGRQGIQPDLTLSYNSYSKNDWVGVGWGLNIGSIQRSTKEGLDYSSNEFSASFSGASAELVSREDDWGADYYGAKIEGAFVKYFYDTSIDAWEATTKDGIKYYFGSSDASRQLNDSSETFKWCLDKVLDTNGNTIKITYVKDDGQIYPQQIDYTGNENGLSATKYVTFTLEDRSDIQISYRTGSYVATNKRLKTISTYADSVLARQYELVYEENAVSGSSRLASVQVVGSERETSIPATAFTYYDGWDLTFETGQVTYTNSLDGGFAFGDINGDGVRDFVKYFAYMRDGDSAYRVYVYPFLSNGDGTFAESSLVQLASCAEGYLQVTLVDVNGDNMADVVSNTDSGDVYTYLSNGDGTFDDGIVSSGPATESIIVMDIDSDGMVDLLRNDEDGGYLYTCLSTAGDGSFNETYETHDGTAGQLTLTEVTGDGITDLIRTEVTVADDENIYGASYVYVGIREGAFSDLCDLTLSGSSIDGLYFSDLNGDGLADMSRIYGADTIETYLATGDGAFDTVQETVFDFSLYNITLADMTGDGLPDLLGTDSEDGGNHYILVSNGDGTFMSPQLFGSASSDASFIFVDVSGDGQADFIKQGGSCLCVKLAQTDGPTDYLETITSPYGGVTTVSYGKTSDYTDNYIPYVIRPVSAITTDDGNGVTSEILFDYSGAACDGASKAFWGFEHVEKTYPNGVTLGTYYYLDENFKGKSYSSELRDPDGVLLESTTIEWDDTYPVDSDRTYAFVNMFSKRVATYDDGVETAYVLTENTEYDNTNGNIIESVISGTGAESVTTTRTFVNKGDWVWRTESKTVTGSVSGLVRKKDFSYEQTTGNLLTRTFYNDSGDDPVETLGYDAYGNLYSITDPIGNVTTIGYDSSDTFAETVTYPATGNNINHEIGTAWDNRYGKATLTTDQNGNDTTTEYDGYGRTKLVSYPDGGEVEYIYHDDASPWYLETRVKESSSSDIVAYSYRDGFGRVFKTVSPGEDGKAITSKVYYDEMGRKYRGEGPYFEGGVVPYSEVTGYDYLGRQLTVQSSKSASDTIGVSIAYTGLSTTYTDPDGYVSITTKDYLGRIVEVQEDSDGGTAVYSYNAAGDLLDYTDDGGNITTFSRNTLGKVISTDDPDTGVWEKTYDANGNLKTQTDSKGQVLTFSYDELDRMTGKTYSTNDPDVTITYDLATNGIGQVYSTSNDNATITTNAYDVMGRITSETMAIDCSSYTSYSTYDYAGKTLTLTYPDGYDVTYSYHDGASLLKSVAGSDGTVFATLEDYESTGNLGFVTYGNNTASVYTYDPYTLRLTEIVTGNANETLQDRSYIYNDSGDIGQIVDGVEGVTYTYGYDSLHRLVSEATNGSFDDTGITYDALGNIMTKTVGSNTFALNYGDSQPHVIDTVTFDGTDYSFIHDDNGNMLQGYNFTDASSVGARTITYTADNMPETISYGGVTSTFLYDGGGMRVKKSVTDLRQNTTDTYYIGGHYEIRDSQEVKYIFAGSLRVAQIVDGVVHYFHKDHLGSSTLSTDEQGVSAEYSNYEPFGGMRDHTGDEISNYKFTDQEFDPESGLYNYNARMYDPVIGRFTTPDPFVQDIYNPQSFNRYAYCLNNPLGYTDPTGYQSEGTDSTASGDCGTGCYLEEIIVIGERTEEPETPGGLSIGSMPSISGSIGTAQASGAGWDQGGGCYVPWATLYNDSTPKSNSTSDGPVTPSDILEGPGLSDAEETNMGQADVPNNSVAQVNVQDNSENGTSNIKMVGSASYFSGLPPEMRVRDLSDLNPFTGRLRSETGYWECVSKGMNAYTGLGVAAYGIGVNSVSRVDRLEPFVKGSNRVLYYWGAGAFFRSCADCMRYTGAYDGVNTFGIGN